MELAYEHILVVDPDKAERWEQEMNEIHNVRELLKEKWLPIIAQVTLPLSQPLRRRSMGNAGGIPASTRIKIMADLKPREPTEDSSPMEFSTWCEEYSIYHLASNLHLASKHEQQINLYSHIDKALRERLKAKICHKTPVMDI